MCLFNTVSQAYSDLLSPPPAQHRLTSCGARENNKSALVRRLWCSRQSQRRGHSAAAQWPGLTHASLSPALLPRLSLFLPPPDKDPWDTRWLDHPTSGPPPTLADSSCPCPPCLRINQHRPKSYKTPSPHSLFLRLPVGVHTPL